MATSTQTINSVISIYKGNRIVLDSKKRFFRGKLVSNNENSDNGIKDGIVQTEGIEDLAVTNAKIDNLAVTSAKIDNLAVTNAKINDLSVDKLTTGTINVAANVGGTNVKIDGTETRILMNDGANDRLLIGRLVGKF